MLMIPSSSAMIGTLAFRAIDGLGAGCSRVVSWDVDDVAGTSNLLGDRVDVVSVRESVLGDLQAVLLGVLGHFISLVFGIWLSRAVEDAQLLSLRNEVLDHLLLLVQRSKVRSPGNVATNRAVELLQVQSHLVIGDRRLQDWN